jgi:hypothetical protein
MTTALQQPSSPSWNNPGQPGQWGPGQPNWPLPWNLGPVVLGVVPGSGPAAGGNSVIIFGLGLSGTAQVHFGTASATVTGGDPLGFTLNAVVPSGTAGTTVPVTVTVSGRTSNPVFYTYTGTTPPLPPTATAIVPATGPTLGGTPFLISGTNLTGATVTFGGVPATVLAGTPSLIAGLAPAGAAGNVPVVVTTAGGTATVPGGYTYTAPPPPPPVITTTITPATGPAAGGGTFTVVGTGLTGATVAFGTAAATITSNTGAVITGTIPAGTAGTTVPVLITTAGGIALGGTYTYV